MPARKKLLLAAISAALVVPAAAFADVLETGPNPAKLASACPADCVVLAKVTGFQNRTSAVPVTPTNTTATPAGGPMVAAKSGRIVAWTVTLGKPNATQRKFFEQDSGLGESAANFTVLKFRKQLKYEVVQQGPSITLTKYFGRTVTFPLTRTISVKKGQVIGLTTKSWIPIMAVNQPTTTSWRASRPKGKCDDTSGTDYSQSTLNKTVQYRCLYRGVQLLYSVTIIPNPPKISATKN